VGGVGVFVSLIYLGIQIRQGNCQVEHNTRSLEVSTYRAITSDLNQFRALLIQDADLGRIYLEGLKDPSKLKPEEQFRFRGLMQTLVSNLELMHRVPRARLLELDSHAPRCSVSRSCRARSPGGSRRVTSTARNSSATSTGWSRVTTQR
jgi:hypothetical protein